MSRSNEETKRLARAAYHEAGHTVVLIENYSVKEISKVEISLGEGMVTVYGDFLDLVKSEKCAGLYLDEWWENTIVGYLAGLAAEYIYDGKPKTLDKSTGLADLIKAQDFMESFYAGIDHIPEKEITSQFILDEYFEKAVQIVESKWSAVEAIAEALFVKRSISGEKAMEIVKAKRKLPKRR